MDPPSPAPPASPQATPPPGDSLRVHQANERTMLAWVRTGLALMGFGFAIARFGLFLRQFSLMSGAASAAAIVDERHLGSRWLGASLVALGMVVNLLATVRYRSIRFAVLRNQIEPPTPWLVYLLGAVVTVIGLVMTALLAASLGD